MSFIARLKHLNIFGNKKIDREENGILSELAFRRVVERERERADRNQHQFSLVLLDPGTSDKNLGATSHIIESITHRVRNVDELGWYDKKRIGIILPYTSMEGAYRLIEYLYDSLDAELPRPVCDVFTYPTPKSDYN